MSINLDYVKILEKDAHDKNELKLYLNIIEKALSSKRKRVSLKNPNYVYYEEHHILPKSLYPEYRDSKDNKVLLLANEHYHVHKLLTNIFPGQKMAHAFWRMTCCNKSKIIISEEDYAKARSLIIKYPPKGYIPDEIERVERSIRMKNSWLCGKIKYSSEAHAKSVETRRQNGGYVRTEEQNESVSKKMKGKIFINNGTTNKSICVSDLEEYIKLGWVRGKKPLSEEHKKHIGIGLKSKGHKSWNKGLPGTFLGKHHTEESKKKMSEAKKGKRHEA